MFKDTDWLMAHWNKSYELTGVRKRTGPYSCRPTYISLMLSEEIEELNPESVARWVGNSSQVIRKNYLKHIKKKKNENRLQKIMEAALEISPQTGYENSDVRDISFKNKELY